MMSDGFGLHAFDAEIVRHRVETGREHSEPAAQEIDLRLGLADAAPQRRNGHAERAQDRRRLRNALRMQVRNSLRMHAHRRPPFPLSTSRRRIPGGIFRLIVAAARKLAVVRAPAMLFGMPVAEKLPSAPLPNVADLRYILDIKEDCKSQGSLKRSSRSCDRLMLW